MSHKPVRAWLTGLWDRLIASDPGLSWLRTALTGATAMASALVVERGFAAVTDVDATDTLVVMLLGAVVSMMGSMALTGQGVWHNVRVAAGFR